MRSATHTGFKGLFSKCLCVTLKIVSIACRKLLQNLTCVEMLNVTRVYNKNVHELMLFF